MVSLWLDCREMGDPGGDSEGHTGGEAVIGEVRLPSSLAEKRTGVAPAQPMAFFTDCFLVPRSFF